MAAAAVAICAGGAPARGQGPVQTVMFSQAKGDGAVNASALVALGDAKFLITDNRAPDALLELDLDAKGAMARPLTRRALAGLAPGALSDPEGMTLAEADGRRFLFVLSSLGATGGKKGGAASAPAGGLARVTLDGEGSLRAEAMPGFRSWLAGRVPSLAAAASKAPDAGGLNVEGLAWDPARGALLLGVRTPLAGGLPIVVPVRLKRLDGPLDAGNLEALPEVRLATGGGGGAGVRDIHYDAEGRRFLVITGRAVSGGDAPFELYEWDGNAEGRVRRFAALAFAPGAKPEGVAAATIGGRRALVFVDDRGGYAVVWEDDPRLRLAPAG